jgi:hypothetical protein
MVLSLRSLFVSRLGYWQRYAISPYFTLRTMSQEAQVLRRESLNDADAKWITLQRLVYRDRQGEERVSTICPVHRLLFNICYSTILLVMGVCQS